MEGLTEGAAQLRLERDGPNTLPRATRSVWRMVLRQFQSVLVYILLVALALSLIGPVLEGGTLVFTDFLDAVVIFAILASNAIFGFVQEYQAEGAIAALDDLRHPTCRVRRGGVERSLDATELVVGDLVMLDAGDRVPADLRLHATAHLQVDEAALTGESVPVDKAIDDDIFAGTLVTGGSGTGVVTATGVQTELGQIAGLVGTTAAPPTPLQLSLQRLGVRLGWLTLGLCALAVGVGLVRGMGVMEILMVSVSLAVSAVPEGLAAVVTVCFAMGVRRMAKKNALVRRLDSLETLGAVTIVCTDKTGTITQNRMRVVEHHTRGDVTTDELATAFASCNHAALPDLGDPTEIALLSFAEAQGAPRLPIDDEVHAFSSSTKFMATRHGETTYLKGAASVITAQCGVTDPAVVAAARRGLRVLAAARQVQGEAPQYLGFVGMEDPPRAGVESAVAQAAQAGIRTMMITGDSPTTAAAIAAQVGIAGQALSGTELDELDDQTLADRIDQIGIVSRVSPAHKLRILHALQARGEVVAMSGDGVNDAPALKGAHVGIAMGERGTDVAREASAIVLADDHFATIITAIQEGRRIHDNIRKFVVFLLRSNFDELLLVLAALATGLALPLLPLHILWINLLTDGLPALALGMEPAEPDIMQRKPRTAGQSLLSGQIPSILFASVLAAAVGYGLWVYLSQHDDLPHARGVLLTFIILIELGMAQSSRSPRPLWRNNPLTNPWLLGATAIVAGTHLVLLYTPLAGIFELAPPSLMEWGVIAGLAVFVVGVFEVVKGWLRG